MSEDQAAVKDAYAETQQKGESAKKAAEAAAKPLEAKYSRPDYGKKTVQMRTSGGYVDTGMQHEVALEGEPKKTDEQVVDEVLAQAESERKAQEELARMGAGEKPKEPMTDEQMLAWLEESESARAAKSEVAALQQKGGETMEFTEAEVALNKFEEMVNAPGADLPKVANVLSKVSEKASASLTTTGKIDEKNILSGLKGEDLAYAEIYVSLLKEVEQKHAVLLGNSPQPYEVAQVLYSKYLGDVLKKTVKNTAYLGSIFKSKIPQLTV
jgi:hypothetical protein